MGKGKVGGYFDSIVDYYEGSFAFGEVVRVIYQHFEAFFFK